LLFGCYSSAYMTMYSDSKEQSERTLKIRKKITSTFGCYSSASGIIGTQTEESIYCSINIFVLPVVNLLANGCQQT